MKPKSGKPSPPGLSAKAIAKRAQNTSAKTIAKRAQRMALAKELLELMFGPKNSFDLFYRHKDHVGFMCRLCRVGCYLPEDLVKHSGKKVHKRNCKAVGIVPAMKIKPPPELVAQLTDLKDPLQRQRNRFKARTEVQKLKAKISNYTPKGPIPTATAHGENPFKFHRKSETTPAYNSVRPLNAPGNNQHSNATLDTSTGRQVPPLSPNAASVERLTNELALCCVDTQDDAEVALNVALSFLGSLSSYYTDLCEPRLSHHLEVTQKTIKLVSDVIISE